VVDPRIEPFLTLDLDGDTYKVVEVQWMDIRQSGGKHHIFLEVVDEGGQRLVGQQIRVSWPGGETRVPIEEKPGEPWGGNFPMFATLGAYAVQVAAPPGRSDAVEGLGLGTPQEPDVKHHTSFGITFRARSRAQRGWLYNLALSLTVALGRTLRGLIMPRST
jgi:hypothetical protein